VQEMLSVRIYVEKLHSQSITFFSFFQNELSYINYVCNYVY